MELDENGFHPGEHQLRKLLHVPPGHNPTNLGLTAHTTRLLVQRSRLLALGLLIRDDDDGGTWPWCTVLCPTNPDSAVYGSQRDGKRLVNLLAADSQVVVFARVAGSGDGHEGTGAGDPVVDLLQTRLADGTNAEEGDRGPVQIGGLGIDLESRDRVKISGIALGGTVVPCRSGGEGEENGWELFMRVKVLSSLGNCPKYLNKKHILSNVPHPRVQSTTLPLPPEALALLQKADLFFMSSSYDANHVAVNHRGGPPGFVRVAHNAASDRDGGSGTTVLVYPEYSGNRLYQTLGNLVLTSRAGLVFPDFDTGDALFVTGTTEIFVGNEAEALLPRSNLAVKLHVHAARFVRNVMGFRAEPGERSPYNPRVRYLSDERAGVDGNSGTGGNAESVTATLCSRTSLTPTIARFRFRINARKPPRWRAGQYVALDFEDELSGGYSHMRDDDPQSLNDDYVRTFTISSPPSLPSGTIPRSSDFVTKDTPQDDEFDITIRNVGKVTNFLFKQNVRAGLEITVKGIEGSFAARQSDGAKITPFVAGGIGITPLLAQLSELDLNKLRLYWTISAGDLGLVADTLRCCPPLAGSTKLFVSGSFEGEEVAAEQRNTQNQLLSQVKQAGVQKLVTSRRMTATDLDIDDPDLAETWYLCAGPSLRKNLLTWLRGKKTVFEDFGY